jgi:transposase
MATEQANTIQKRRYHTRAYKAQVVAECVQEGASTAAVALAHGLKVTMVWKWVREAGTAKGLRPVEFVPMVVPATLGQSVEIDLRRGDLHVSVRWPTAESVACAEWLRELLR